METAQYISLIVAGLALLVSALGLRRNQHGDTATNAAERANMTADIRYIRSSVDDIKLEYKGIQRDLTEIRERIVKVEQSTKSAHNRIDGMEKGGA